MASRFLGTDTADHVLLLVASPITVFCRETRLALARAAQSLGRKYISATCELYTAASSIPEVHHISRRYTMVSALTIFAFMASTLAVAVEDSEFTLKVLLKRQESTSGAQYQCHADCGKSLKRQTHIELLSENVARLYHPRCKRRQLQ